MCLYSPFSVALQRAESSIARLQELNPHVKMRADTSDISDKPDEFFLDFDIIVLTGAPLSTIVCT
jgi:molybdopterin/thiamine biosynthesis adenylyltransferase